MLDHPTILHVDMDAFFASVEQRDDPRLRGRPVLVGSPPERRGVVAAASYEARGHGIRSAMPMGQAVRLCPEAVIVPPDLPRYAAESRALMALLESYTPLVEPLSLDEAFLDLSGTERLSGPLIEVARSIRARIRAERGLAASAGLAGSKLVAKIASDLAKPDGLLVVTPAETQAFLAPLPVGRMYGIGPRAQEHLARIGVATLGDLARAPADRLVSLLGCSGEELAARARGIDLRPVTPGRRPKAHSRERTFPVDLTRTSDRERQLLGFADQVAGEVRRQGLLGWVVRLKVRTAAFRTLDRSRRLPEPTDLMGPLYEVGRSLLAALEPLPPVRLLGLGLGELVPREAPRQRVLFQADQGRRQALLAQGIDAIRLRWGEQAILPGRLLEEEGPRP